MCGLIGVTGNIFHKDLKFVKQALIADHFRGVHSVGLAAVKRDEVATRKMAINPIDFLDLTSVKSMMTMQAIAFIGHNRHATQGAVNNNNAHPFTHGDITLAHNGTLTNKHALERDFQAPKFDTDSELVCWLIDNYELSAVIPALEGAFALTWWDDRDKSMNIIRNSERPLHVAGVGCNVYWASEKKMLEWLLDRNEISTKDTMVYQPKVGMHLCFKYANNKMDLQTQEYTVAKKPITRTPQSGKGTGAGKGKGKSKGNVVALPSPKSDAYAEYNSKYGVSFEKDCDIYVYADQLLDTRYSEKLNKTDVIATLSIAPYTDVRLYFLDKFDGLMSKDTIALKVKIKALKKDRGMFVITASNSLKDIAIIKKDDKAGLAAMDAWEFRNTVPFEAEEEIKPQDVASDFRGYDNKSISYLKFEAVINKGCCVCGQTLDPVSESLDRTCTFVTDDEVVCEECASCKQTMHYYGFMMEN